MVGPAQCAFPSRRKQDREFEVLQEVSHHLTDTLEVQDFLEAIVHLVVEKLRVKACSIRLNDGEAGPMALRMVHGIPDWPPSNGPLVIWKGGFGEELHKGRIVAIQDVTKDTRVECPSAAAARGIRSMLAAGLYSGGQVFGALCAYTEALHDFDRDEVQAFEVLASQAAVGIQAARMHGELIEKKVMEREMELAERVQNHFMPPQDLRSCERYDICARTSPCWQIGGDFYDLVEFGPSHFGVAIGDVSGKGIGASILMATTRSALRAHIENVFSARDIVAKVNAGLVRDTGVDQFVSLFYMVMEPDGLLTYVNAGHNPPMLFRNGDRMPLDVGGPILGVATWVEHKAGTAHVKPGDIVLLYTDGMTEAFSAFGEEFGAKRLCDVVAANRSLSCEDLAEKLYQAVEEFSGHQPPTDDRTLVLIKVN